MRKQRTQKKFRDESSSISNQRMVVERYCRQNNITLVREFKDDGWSGGNFDRPDFQAMMRELERGKVNTVITKDLSRLGRDMRESSYYAEQFFPEHGIHYIAINDNFDSERDNVMAPFQFAMNEVYLRDGSRKVKDVLKAKRESGQYCACPPYGYKKNPRDKNLLVPDEETAPIVQRIFDRAAQGDSARKIALDLAADGVIPPLKYRVLYRDDFSDKGAARASDIWNYTTVKRILKNIVRTDLNLLIDLTDEDVKEVTDAAVRQVTSEDVLKARQEKLKRSKDRLAAIDKIITKLYTALRPALQSTGQLDAMRSA